MAPPAGPAAFGRAGDPEETPAVSQSPQAAPDVAAAQADYVSRVVHPAFFDRLAARGYTPSTEKQAAQMLRMADDLAERVEAARSKQAARRDDLLSQAYDDYCRAVGIPPADDVGADAEKAAAAYLRDPEALAAAATLVRAAAAAAEAAD